MKAAVELCACGQPLHYTDPLVERLVRKAIAAFGEGVPITVPERWPWRTFLVSRHYIALHGFSGFQLPGIAARLGFEEVFVCPKCLRVSHNPNDLKNRYCGACKEFFV